MTEQKNRIILGIDEVGRGAWAGPLVVGAVILRNPQSQIWQDLTDSKKLTKNRREKFAKVITEKAVATALGWVAAPELDRVGLSQALRLATARAVKNILVQGAKFDEIVIDGKVNFLADTALADKVVNLPKADLLVKAVSAASVIAKVARDQHLEELAKVYPEYGFNRHVGYGTSAHRAAIKKFGLTPEHRRSFRPVQTYALAHPTPADGRRLSETNVAREATGHQQTHQQTATLPPNLAHGHGAESAVAEYLKAHGHRILTRNFRTRFYEIDLISVDETAKKLYFTEVKYRRNSALGSPLEAVTAEKQERMHAAAEAFLALQPALLELYDPQLAVAAVSGKNFTVDDWFALAE